MVGSESRYYVQVGLHVYPRTCFSELTIYKNNSLCWSRTKRTSIIIIWLKINLLSPWYSWKLTELALNNNQSKFYLKSVHFITIQHKLSRAFQTDMHNKIKYSTTKTCHSIQNQYTSRQTYAYICVLTTGPPTASASLRSHCHRTRGQNRK
jgi:hypothetical protein